MVDVEAGGVKGEDRGNSMLWDTEETRMRDLSMIARGKPRLLKNEGLLGHPRMESHILEAETVKLRIGNSAGGREEV